MPLNFYFQQVPLDVKLRSDATFGNYFPGNNQNQVDYLKEIINSNVEKFAYIWGAAGVGKTHLLQACCHLANKNNLASVYLPLSKAEQLSPKILQDLEHLDLICIDDVSAIATQNAWEENLFYLYNRCLHSNARLILAGQLAAQEISFVLQDLQSRLVSIVPLFFRELNDQEKLQVLQSRANDQGMELSEEVGQFLINRCERSMTNLFAVLDQLDHASLSAKRKLSVPFVKMVLGL